MTKLPQSAHPRHSPEKPPPRYTPELAARKKALEMMIASETELYQERMTAYESQLADIEREAMRSA